MPFVYWFIAESHNLPSDIWGVIIGFNDRGTEGIYVWDSTGQPLSYTNWAEGDPNDSHPGEDYGGLTIDEVLGGQWVDTPCDMRWPPFCKILP